MIATAKDLMQRAFRYAHYTIALREFGVEKRRILFVLGHMRSGSSLLAHILNSNHQILGYGEAHLWYHNRRSLIDLDRDVRHQFRAHGEAAPKTRYTMDKVLHRHFVDASILQCPFVRAIVLVRKPQDTLPSIVKVTERDAPEDALEYYIGRLQRLDELIPHLGERVIFVTYQDIVEHTENVLQKIEQFLELQSPLTSEYKTMWSTGQEVIGDPTETIHTGKITSRSSKKADIAISEATLQKAKTAYTQFKQRHSLGEE